MPNKTIYVKDADMWERAKELAGKDGLSSVIGDAIAAYVKRKEHEAQGINKYRLEVGAGFTGTADDDGSIANPREGSAGRIAFEGRLLHQCELPVLVDVEELGGGKYEERRRFSVYHTKGKKLILTVEYPLQEPYPRGAYHHGIYSSLNQLKEDEALGQVDPIDRAPFLDAIAEELGEDWAVWVE